MLKEITENRDINVDYKNNTLIYYIANKSTKTNEYKGNIANSKIKTKIEPTNAEDWCNPIIESIGGNTDIQRLNLSIKKNNLSSVRDCKIKLINTDKTSDIYLHVIQEAVKIEYNYYVYNPNKNANNKFIISDSYIIQLTNDFTYNNTFNHENDINWYKNNTDPNGFRKLGAYDGNDEFIVLPVFTSNQTRNDDYFNINNVEFTGSIKYYLNNTTDDLGDKNISELFKLDKLTIKQGNNNVEGFFVNIKTQSFAFPVNNNKIQNPNGEECYLKCKINNGEDLSTLDIRLNIIYPYDYPYISINFTQAITAGRLLFNTAEYINNLSVIVTDFMPSSKNDFNTSDPNKLVKKIKFVNWESGDNLILNGWNSEDSLKTFNYNLEDVLNMSLENIKQNYQGKLLYTFLIKYSNSTSAQSNNIDVNNMTSFALTLRLSITRRQIIIDTMPPLSIEFTYPN